MDEVRDTETEDQMESIKEECFKGWDMRGPDKFMGHLRGHMET